MHAAPELTNVVLLSSSNSFVCREPLWRSGSESTAFRNGFQTRATGAPIQFLSCVGGTRAGSLDQDRGANFLAAAARMGGVVGSFTKGFNHSVAQAAYGMKPMPCSKAQLRDLFFVCSARFHLLFDLFLDYRQLLVRGAVKNAVINVIGKIGVFEAASRNWRRRAHRQAQLVIKADFQPVFWNVLHAIDRGLLRRADAARLSSDLQARQLPSFSASACFIKPSAERR